VSKDRSVASASVREQFERIIGCKFAHGDDFDLLGDVYIFERMDSADLGFTASSRQRQSSDDSNRPKGTPDHFTAPKDGNRAATTK
jgi:hypothetical protein